MLLWVASAITGDTITGEIVTGKATSSPTNVSIEVIGTFPTLAILLPEDKTYLKNESLILSFSVSGQQAVWYNLDRGANTTLVSSPAYFNASEGSHTLYLFANNTDNNITIKNVTFGVNLTIFRVSYNEYNSSYKGNSTELMNYTYEELQNLSGFILENTNYGKILFNQGINLTDTNGNTLNLDSYVNISSNRIEIDGAYLPNLNKSSTLSLYGLSFGNPRILRDGSVCSSSICTQQSYSGDILIFNVTHFTIYSAEETPEGVMPVSGGGGVGGGGIAIVKKIKKFSLDKEKIKIKLKQGETKEEKIIIKNTGNYSMKITLSLSGVEGFIKMSENEFELSAGELKSISLDIIARENSIPELYTGKLVVKGDGIEKEILIAMEIESKRPLFDVAVGIPEKFLKISPGEDIVANIKLFRAVKTGKNDVEIEYSVRDAGDNLIISDTESMSIEAQANFIKTLRIPEDAKEGDYVFYVRVKYDEQIASGSEWFKVEKAYISVLSSILSTALVFIPIVFIIIVIIILFEMRRVRKSKETGSKINKKMRER